MSTEDLREKILKWIPAEFGAFSEIANDEALYNKSDVFKAMDEYFTKRAMELLEYMAKNKVECCDVSEGIEEIGRDFYYKGEWITAKELFENFL